MLRVATATGSGSRQHNEPLGNARVLRQPSKDIEHHPVNDDQPAACDGQVLKDSSISRKGRLSWL